MGDRSQAEITIGGSVHRKDWREVEDALTSEFGESAFSLLVLRNEEKALKKATGVELVAANARYEAELKKSRRSPPFASVSIPLKKLDRLAGITLSFLDTEANGGRFDDLQEVLRGAGVSYMVRSSGRTGSWPPAHTWWLREDPHRGEKGWGPFYNTNGERYLELIDGEQNVRPGIDAEQILAAFELSRDEFAKTDLPPGPDLGDMIIQRAIHIGTDIPVIPPLSILEK